MGVNMELLGIDIGFGFTKATNGQDTLVFKSLFGDAKEMQFWADFGEKIEEDYFHVTIEGKSYFVGNLAEQQSNVRQFTLDQDKMISDFIKVLALTAAGKFYGSEVPINVVSGLPIGYFKQNQERFAKTLRGYHDIVYQKPDGSKISKKIYINKVRMMPQPLGTVINLLMDENGKIVNKELEKQKVGVIDIGFRTTDFTIFDRLQYIDRGSSTLDTGISKAFSVIANKLQERSGVNIEVYRLYKAVESGFIKMKGHGFDFSKIRDKIFSQLATRIANDVDRLWTEDWDIDTIILTGGGSVELEKHLQPLISGNVMPVKNEIDARLNNVQGYYKFGKYIWGQSGMGEHDSAPK
jgi:plasmid segregation protein ParM